VRHERGAAGTEERAERIPSYVSTHPHPLRDKRRIATCTALQATLFKATGLLLLIYSLFTGPPERGSPTDHDRTFFNLAARSDITYGF
jgi:hypothetical protein